MSSLFSIEELVNGNPAGVTNSKDETRKRTIKQLDPIRMQYIQSMMNEFNVIAMIFVSIQHLLKANGLGSTKKSKKN